MYRGRSQYVFGICVFLFGTLWAQNSPPEIEVTHNQKYCPAAPIPIVETVTISDADPGDSTLEEVFVQISEGYIQGSDILTLGGVTPNISSNWIPSEGLLRLYGTASFTEYETAISNVFFLTTQNVFSANRAISINLGSANFLPSTGHYYFYVPNPGISWTQARAEAEAQTYFGLQGYLATITTEEEATLAGEQSAGTGWIGGSDAEIEGTWKWVTGPEAGMIFWIGQFNGSAPNNEYSFWNCAEPNNQGNEDYAHITDRSVAGCNNNSDPSYYGSWNDLPNDSGTGDPSNPYYPKGYIVEFGGFPDEPEINLSASSVIQMPQVNVTNQEVCGNGIVEIALEGNADTYFWFDSASSTVPFFSGTTYTTSLNTSMTYWISPRFGNCPIGGLQPVTVEVNDLPNSFDQTVVQCDSEGDSDGITNFNLSVYNDDITGGAFQDIVVRFFEDSELSINIDANSYQNQFNGQIVFAQVQNTETLCYSLAEIELRVSVPVSNSAYLEVCDDLPEDGFAEFDLSEADGQVITNPGAGLSTSFYETYNDALLQLNPLPVSYRNTIPNSQTIYVRLQEGNNCFGINEVFLNVRPLPLLMPDETVYYCINEFPSPITLNGGILNDIPNNYYYQWSTGETTMSIEVNEPGTYTVEVSEVVGCSNTRTITVLPSEIASIETIEVTTNGEFGTLVVSVSGIGEYSYSIDSPSGPYQDSNIFENVAPGIRTVYVKETRGLCGIEMKDVSVIGFPKFFTPNGDGQNDFWQIKGFNTQFPLTTTVQIFDRFGKLLIELNPEKSFWDGRYRGYPMPSSDYWYKTILEDGTEYTGHFALKR